MNDLLLKYYENNQDEIEKSWEEYIVDNEWGSGLDTIKITDDIFWEFVEKKRESND